MNTHLVHFLLEYTYKIGYIMHLSGILLLIVLWINFFVNLEISNRHYFGMHITEQVILKPNSE